MKYIWKISWLHCNMNILWAFPTIPQATRCFKRTRLTVWLTQRSCVSTWPRCPALVYRPYSQSGTRPARWPCESVCVCVWICSMTTQCQATVCMPAHIHGRHELAASVTGKMWCWILCHGEMSTYYGTTQKASKTWACKHHLSICTCMLTLPSSLQTEGRTQPFVCLGGFSSQCPHIRTEQEKVVLLFKALAMLTIKGPFSCSCVCIFLSNKSGAPSCT